MLKKPKYLGKIIGFSIALTLFIIANGLQSSTNSRLGKIKGEIESIERYQEAHSKYMMSGEDDFQKGQLFLTIGLMTRDVDHDLNSVYEPVAISMIGGLSSLNKTLPEDRQGHWETKIEELKDEFLMAKKGDISQFSSVFNSGVLILRSYMINLKIKAKSWQRRRCG